MDQLMGRNEYARHRGCSPNAVKKAEDDGRIAPAVKRDAAGVFEGIDWRRADELWARNTDLDQSMNGNGGVLPPLPQADKPAENGASSATSQERNRDDDVRGDLLESKLRQQRADTEIRELELAERRGELVSAEEQRKVLGRRYRAIRDQVLGVPDRLAWLSREDRLKLAEELKRVLHDLSNDATAESAALGAEERLAA